MRSLNVGSSAVASQALPPLRCRAAPDIAAPCTKSSSNRRRLARHHPTTHGALGAGSIASVAEHEFGRPIAISGAGSELGVETVAGVQRDLQLRGELRTRNEPPGHGATAACRRRALTTAIRRAPAPQRLTDMHQSTASDMPASHADESATCQLVCAKLGHSRGKALHSDRASQDDELGRTRREATPREIPVTCVEREARTREQLLELVRQIVALRDRNHPARRAPPRGR